MQELVKPVVYHQSLVVPEGIGFLTLEVYIFQQFSFHIYSIVGLDYYSKSRNMIYNSQMDNNGIVAE